MYPPKGIHSLLIASSGHRPSAWLLSGIGGRGHKTCLFRRVLGFTVEAPHVGQFPMSTQFPVGLQQQRTRSLTVYRLNEVEGHHAYLVLSEDTESKKEFQGLKGNFLARCFRICLKYTYCLRSSSDSLKLAIQGSFTPGMRQG